MEKKTLKEIARECVRELEDDLNLEISGYGDHYAWDCTPERFDKAANIIKKYMEQAKKLDRDK